MADRDKVAFDEAALVRDLGISYVTIPVTPKTLSIKDVEKLEEVLRNTSGPVLIHCHSSNRAGVLFGLYLNQFRGFDLPDGASRPSNRLLPPGRRPGTSTKQIKQ
jgi:uncharacterized protein (TIGR01244 family)